MVSQRNQYRMLIAFGPQTRFSAGLGSKTKLLVLGLCHKSKSFKQTDCVRSFRCSSLLQNVQTSFTLAEIAHRNWLGFLAQVIFDLCQISAAELPVDIWHQSVSNWARISRRKFVRGLPTRMCCSLAPQFLVTLPSDFWHNTRFYHVVRNLWNWVHCVAEI